MNLASIDIVQHFFALIWPMIRISAMFIAAPIYSLKAFNLRLRILLALVLAVMIYPQYRWPQIDPLSAEGLFEVFNQIAIGAVMGMTLQVVVASVVVAGQSMSNSMGMSMASMIDPAIGNVPVISEFLQVLSTLIFVSLGGHGLLMGLVIDSFQTLPIGQIFAGQAAWGLFVQWSSMVFLGALLMALPIMVTLLFVNMGLGVLTRATPSLQIFSVALPASIIAGFLVLWLSLGHVGARIQWLWVQAFEQVRHLFNLA
jgi:flagellar biosynthetic protein FliR